MTTPPDDAATSVLPPTAGPPSPGPPPDYEPEPSRGLGWGLLIGLLVLVALAGAAAAAYFATRDDSGPTTTTTTTVPATTTRPAVASASRVFVPDVTGLKQEKAASRLGAAHLVPVVEYKPTKKPTGVVVTQKPKAAKRVARGTNVTIFVDKGAPTVKVPDVTGVAVADAGARLVKAGFKAQTTQVTADQQPGTVVSQVPAAGSKAKKGIVVTLSIARRPPGAATSPTTPTTTASGTTTAPAPATQPTTTAASTTTPAAATATVPDLSGMDVQSASQALIAVNLLATIQYVPADDPLGTVVEQSPGSGGTAKQFSRVTVSASSGPGQKQQMTVPSAVGQTLQQAVATIKGAGLRLIFVKVPVSTRAQVGKIVQQTPATGSTAPKNAQVLVYLGVLR